MLFLGDNFGTKAGTNTYKFILLLTIDPALHFYLHFEQGTVRNDSGEHGRKICSFLHVKEIENTVAASRVSLKKKKKNKINFASPAYIEHLILQHRRMHEYII